MAIELQLITECLHHTRKIQTIIKWIQDAVPKTSSARTCRERGKWNTFESTSALWCGAWLHTSTPDTVRNQDRRTLHTIQHNMDDMNWEYIWTQFEDKHCLFSVVMQESCQRQFRLVTRHPHSQSSFQGWIRCLQWQPKTRPVTSHPVLFEHSVLKLSAEIVYPEVAGALHVGRWDFLMNDRQVASERRQCALQVVVDGAAKRCKEWVSNKKTFNSISYKSEIAHIMPMFSRLALSTSVKMVPCFS